MENLEMVMENHGKIFCQVCGNPVIIPHWCRAKYGFRDPAPMRFYHSVSNTLFAAPKMLNRDK